ncbi:MAG: hypothetical protein K9H49_08390 [Bacteroidales bacterium]|nr:hypothetical protein [Bacteroidales bacterium]MCF8404726.1 hypothetical protein [Bacteroidales bacterium]
MQRIGLDASGYSILNVHKIGIDAPPSFIFEELEKWNGDSTCWPNHIAQVNLVDDKLDDVQILLFGFRNYPLKLKNGVLGIKYIPLFNLKVRKLQAVPGPNDIDNARYILFESSGGYPIGFFTIYIRSSIEDDKAKEQSQIFFVVGFNFFGKENVTTKNLLVKIWIIIHNRVTRNVINRFKKLCEWRFEKIQAN